MDEWRRSGQIPAFGNWDLANELPITRYFESARQAGLTRHSSASGECGQYMRGDLYDADFNKTSCNLAPPGKTRLREKRVQHVEDQRKQGKVCAVTERARKLQQPLSMYDVPHNKNDSHVTAPAVPRPTLSARASKPVDEDLYKIPPAALRSSKQKRRPGFFSCLVLDCDS